MAFEDPGADALDYQPCRYGRSKLLFRGPRRMTHGPYAVVLGGGETYGKFVRAPWPAQLEEALDMPVLNLGYMNAGVDVFRNDAAVMELCEGARLVVIQLLPPQNLSNRFYAVHPRRNDRFVRASPLMCSLFREVDFSDYHFTGHMLGAIRALAPAKFEMIEQELKSAWVARMRSLLDRVGGHRILLWIADPNETGLSLIDEEMAMDLRPRASELVQIRPSEGAVAMGTEGMVFPPLDAPVAQRMPSLATHAEIAERLLPVLRRYL